MGRPRGNLLLPCSYFISGPTCDDGLVVDSFFWGVLKYVFYKHLGFLRCLEVLEGLQRLCRMNFLQISSKSDLMVPSYDQATKINDQQAKISM